MDYFAFKRGDTVRICLVQYDKLGPDAKIIGIDEQYGIVLNVDATKQGICKKGIGEVEIRRDNDGSLFTVDLNGQAHNVDGEQYAQVQKCFLPVSAYKGTLVEWMEVIAHPSEHQDCIRLTVLGVAEGKVFRDEREDHFMDSKLHFDFSKEQMWNKWEKK